MVALESGSVIAGRYRLERVLAQGGMGAVWVARHLHLDLDVAVKLMSPVYVSSAEARARFEREAKASAQLKSPHFVHVLDYGVEADAPFLVMELLQGEDLQGRLRRERRLTIADTQRIVHQIARGLRVAHDAGLVHRDLKPANIFLARQGNEEVVKVLDFGVAKVTGLEGTGAETATGMLIGSPQYMSPEQVRSSRQLDRRSDLWSLGVIVFRCLTGRLPFQGEVVGDLIIEIWTETVPRATSIAADLDPAVDAFLERALRREPHLRFQTADELDEAFSIVAGVPLAVTGVGGSRNARAEAPLPAPQPDAAPSPPVPAAPFAPLVALTASDALTESLSRSKMGAMGVPMTALLGPAAPPAGQEGGSVAGAPGASSVDPAERATGDDNTLTSAGQSLAVAPVRSSRAGLVVAAVVVVSVLVFGAVALLGAPAKVATPAVPEEHPAIDAGAKDPAPDTAAASPVETARPAPSASHVRRSPPPSMPTTHAAPVKVGRPPAAPKDDPLREM